MSDWTVDPETGRANSSPLFNELSVEVGNLIRQNAVSLLGGYSVSVGRLILAQLAHTHGLAPVVATTLDPQEGNG